MDTQKDFSSSWTSRCSSRGQTSHDSFTSTPSFGLLAIESCCQRLPYDPKCDHVEEDSLSDILEDDESDHDKEYDMQPYPHQRHESASSFHWSFEESLEICFGGEEGECGPTTSDPRHISMGKPVSFTTGLHKRQVSLEPPSEDRPGHCQGDPPTTSASLLDKSMSSVTSLNLNHADFDRCQSEIRFIPDNVLRDRTVRLERSLNLFSPHKGNGYDSSMVMDDIEEPTISSSPPRLHENIVMLGPTHARCQPLCSETDLLTFSDGRRFVGTHMGKHHLVRGIMTYPDGTVYRGRWMQGKRHGRGMVEFPDGSRYFGDFEGGEYHGQGKMTWSDGGYYVGTWRRGQIQGNGTEVRADGSIRHDGLWKRGRPCRTTLEQQARTTDAKANTNNNDTPKIIHVVQWASMRSIDSSTKIGTSVSMNVETLNRCADATLYPMDVLTHEART